MKGSLLDENDEEVWVIVLPKKITHTSTENAHASPAYLREGGFVNALFQREQANGTHYLIGTAHNRAITCADLSALGIQTQVAWEDLPALVGRLIGVVPQGPHLRAVLQQVG